MYMMRIYRSILSTSAILSAICSIDPVGNIGVSEQANPMQQKTGAARAGLTACRLMFSLLATASSS
jgi:hypothetical protein